MEELLKIALPILMGLLGIGLQKVWTIIKSNQYNLEDHEIISDLNINLQKISTWFVERNRQVFIDALEIKLKVWKDEIAIFTKEINNKYISRQKLKHIFIEWAINTIDKYNNEWKVNGVPDKVIKHINKIHQIKVDKLLKEINTIISDRTYPNSQFIKREIFTILRLLLSETKDDFNDIVYRSKYNGEFKDVYYKDIPINDEQYLKQKNKL